MNRAPQIAVIGSAHSELDPAYITAIAEETGARIAEAGAVLLFGAEKDCTTLPTIAALQARKLGGMTVGITYGSSQEIHNPESAGIIIASGLERGGGREAALCFSADALISLGGGAGTLAELAIAYQYRKPIVSIAGSGGWSDKLAGQYIDARERVQIVAAQNPQEAVETAISLATQ